MCRGNRACLNPCLCWHIVHGNTCMDIIVRKAIVLSIMSAASSKSLIVRSPDGLLTEMSCCVTVGCHLCCQTQGCASSMRLVSIQKLPIPNLEASVAGKKCGGCKTRCAMGTGNQSKVYRRCSQSQSAAASKAVIHSQRFDGLVNRCCRMENKCLELWMAGTMLCHSPKRCCHFRQVV